MVDTVSQNATKSLKTPKIRFALALKCREALDKLLIQLILLGYLDTQVFQA